MNFQKLLYKVCDYVNLGGDNVIVRDSVVSISVRAGSALFSLLAGILLARILGPEQFGIYSFCLAIITMISVPTQLGLPNLIVRFIAEYSSNQEWGKLKGLLKTANKFVSLSSLGAFFIVNGYIFFFSDWNIHYKYTILWASILIPLFSFAGVFGAALRGFKNIAKGLAPEGLLRNAFLCGLVGIVFWALGSNLWAYSAMALHAASALAAFLFAYFWLKKLKKKMIPAKNKPVFETKRWISVALPLLLTGGMHVIKYRTDVILLGFFSTSAMIGIYEVVIKGAALITFGLNAVNLALAPYFSSLYAKSKLEELQKLVTKSARIIFAVSLPVLVIFVFKAKGILSVLFGSDYAVGSTALIIICVGYFFSVLMGSVGLLLIMTDYERDMLWAVGFSSLLNAILNLILIPYYDIQGAAIASALSVMIQNLMMGIFVYKRLKIKTTVLGFV